MNNVTRPVLGLFGLSLAYFITGRLGLLLAIPPGYATSIWPPSGIALAGLLLLGPRAWVGVFLGSFLTNISISFDTSSHASLFFSTMVATTIALGASGQALFSAWMIRKTIGFPNRLENEKDIGLFLLLGGPLGCLINATISTACLIFSGIVPLADGPFTWFNWWVGDAIGVVVFAPIAVVLGTRTYLDVWRKRSVMVCVFLMPFVTVVSAFVYTRHLYDQRINEQFETDAEAVVHRIDTMVAGLREITGSLGAFYGASQHVDREEFNIFAVHLLNSRIGIQALEWVPRVTREQRRTFELDWHKHHKPNFQFTELDRTRKLIPARDRDDYFPVYYVEPFAGNEAALGFDLGSIPNRRKALLLARETGNLSLSEPVKLVQDKVQGKSVIFFQPVFEAAATVSKQSVLRGFVLSVFRMHDVIAHTLDEDHKNTLNVFIRDMDNALSDPTLFGEAISHALQKRFDLKIANREWEVVVSGTSDFYANFKSWDMWALLIGGLSLAALFNAFVLVITGRTETVQRIVEEKTRDLKRYTEELERSNQELDDYAFIIAHDLKEPLRGIHTHASLVMSRYGNTLDDNGKRKLKRMQEFAIHMGTLLDELLKYSRISHMEKKLEWVDTREMLDQLIDSLETLVVSRNVKITFDETLPSIQCERFKLQEIFRNLITNGIKYNESTTPEIHIGHTSIENDDGVFYVKDNGIGIPKDAYEKIFRLFKRLNHRQKYGEGTGFGLTLVKKMVESQGGRIWLSSTPGEGTTFFFTCEPSNAH